MLYLRFSLSSVVKIPFVHTPSSTCRAIDETEENQETVARGARGDAARCVGEVAGLIGVARAVSPPRQGSREAAQEIE